MRKDTQSVSSGKVALSQELYLLLITSKEALMCHRCSCVELSARIPKSKPNKSSVLCCCVSQFLRQALCFLGGCVSFNGLLSW